MASAVEGLEDKTIGRLGAVMSKLDTVFDRLVLDRLRAIKYDWEDLTFARACSVLLGFAYFYQPFIDKGALLAWYSSFFSSHKSLFVLGTFFVAHGTFWLANLAFYILYKLQIPFIEQFKVDKKPWPWMSPDPAERADYRRRAIRTTLLTLASHVFFVLPMTWLGYDANMDFRPETIPPWYISMAQLFGSSLIYNFGFYWAHRLLHVKWLYGYFHKMHHTLKPSVGIVANWNHPVDNLITNMIPFGLSVSLMGMHGYTYWMSLALVVLIGVDDHSGYSMPCSPFRLFPFAVEADYHYWHHISTGNFGSPFMDDLFGTNDTFKAWKMQQRALEKQKSQMKKIEPKDIKSPTTIKSTGADKAKAA